MAKKLDPKLLAKKEAQRKQLFLWMAGCAAFCVVTAAILVYALQPSDTEKAITLQERLLAIDENTSRQDRNALFVELARAVDRMNHDDLQQFRRQIREEQQTKLDDAVDDYLLAPEANRTAIIDRELTRFDRMQDVFAAIDGGSRGRPRGHDARRSDDNRPEEANAVKSRSEEQEKQVALQRSTFFDAMKKRAKEKGLAFHPRRIRG
jgi:hypothetical protein